MTAANPYAIHAVTIDSDGQARTSGEGTRIKRGSSVAMIPEPGVYLHRNDICDLLRAWGQDPPWWMMVGDQAAIANGIAERLRLLGS